jgi:predicted NBD/HSP70 family sugar kinase
MPQFSVSVPHNTTKDVATEKVKKMLDHVAEKYADQVKNLEQHFEGDKLVFSFKTLGITVSGEGTVDAENVNIKGNIPFAAMMFKGKIESSLRDSLVRLMGPKPA